MLKPLLIRLTILLGSAAPLAAQTMPTPLPQADPALMAALAANTRRTVRPALFVLSHKSELTLTPHQLEQLDILARAEEDSAVVRKFRQEAMASRMQNNEPPSGWSGPVNESQVRTEACERAGATTEALINLYRDRQAVGKILTGKQIALIEDLETSDLNRVLKTMRP